MEAEQGTGGQDQKGKEERGMVALPVIAAQEAEGQEFALRLA